MELYSNFLSEYNINEIEYALNCDKPSIMPDTMLMNIPKLMPMIPRSKPLTFSEGLSKGIYCNDDKCKVEPPETITCQNYLTIDRHINQHPEFPDKDNGEGIMERFNEFYCEIMHGDIRKIFFTDRI